MVLLFLLNLKSTRGHLGQRAIVCVLLQLSTECFLGFVAAVAAEAPLDVSLFSFVQPSAHIWCCSCPQSTFWATRCVFVVFRAACCAHLAVADLREAEKCEAWV